MTNSAEPDQLASKEANWSGSALFAKIGHVVFSIPGAHSGIFEILYESYWYYKD